LNLELPRQIGGSQRACRLVLELDASGLDDPAPLGDFAADVIVKLLGVLPITV